MNETLSFSEFLLKKISKTEILFSTIMTAIIMFTLITIMDLTSNDDSLSNDPIINHENVQYEIRSSETKFRDEISKSLKNLYEDKNFFLIDSISRSGKESNEIKKFIILSKLKSGVRNYDFEIKTEKSTTPLVLLEKLKVKFEIDFTKLNNIIKSSKSNIIEDNIKYGNYLKTSYEYEKKIRIDYLIVASFLIIALIVIFYYITRIGLKGKGKLEDIIENLDEDRDVIKKAQKILNDDKIDVKEIEALKKLVTTLELNLDTYKFDNILESILYQNTIKAEKKAQELYNRSTLMLILGLLIAIVGVLIFYFTLPEFKVGSSKDYVVLTIRPTLILLFIQSISFYLLRQYRSLINDYKYFHNEYLKKSQIFTTHQLMQTENISDLEMKLIESLIYQAKNDKQSENISENDLPNEKVLDVIKTIIDKFK